MNLLIISFFHGGWLKLPFQHFPFFFKLLSWHLLYHRMHHLSVRLFRYCLILYNFPESQYFGEYSGAPKAPVRHVESSMLLYPMPMRVSANNAKPKHCSAQAERFPDTPCQLTKGFQHCSWQANNKKHKWVDSGAAWAAPALFRR